jgi:hypothetical protein
MVINIQSVLAKRTEWLEAIATANPDVVIGSETWLRPDILDNEFMPPEYKVYRRDRQDGYGGTLIAIKKTIVSEEIEIHDSNLELCCAKVHTIRNHPLIICSAYRPPNRDVCYQDKL